MEVVAFVNKSCGLRRAFPSSALAKLGRLETLTMVGLNLTGTVGPELNLLRGLRELHLSENQLAGPLPRLSGPTRHRAARDRGSLGAGKAWWW